VKVGKVLPYAAIFTASPKVPSARRLLSFSTSGSLSPAAHVAAALSLLFGSVGHIKCLSFS
jgi:hypothetical protein